MRCNKQDFNFACQEHQYDRQRHKGRRRGEAGKAAVRLIGHGKNECAFNRLDAMPLA